MPASEKTCQDNALTAYLYDTSCLRESVLLEQIIETPMPNVFCIFPHPLSGSKCRRDRLLQMGVLVGPCP